MLFDVFRSSIDITLIQTKIVPSLGQLFKLTAKSSKNKFLKSFNNKISEKITKEIKILHQKGLLDSLKEFCFAVRVYHILLEIECCFNTGLMPMWVARLTKDKQD